VKAIEKMNFKIFILFLLISKNIIAQNNESYILTNKSDNSEINYELFNCFIEFLDCENYKDKYSSIEDVFKPINGDFIIYNFIKTFRGESYTGETKTFHDLLILKIDKESNKIIDGFQYTKEWAEMPPSTDLYRLTNKSITIDKIINIKDLEFKNLDYFELTEDDLLDESNILITK